MSERDRIIRAIGLAVKCGDEERARELQGELQTLTLEAERFSRSVKYERDIPPEFIADGLRQAVSSWYIASINSDHSMEFPENWWEALKDAWAPVWFRKRWPVRKKRVIGRMFFPQVDMDGLRDQRVYSFFRLSDSYVLDRSSGSNVA